MTTLIVIFSVLLWTLPLWLGKLIIPKPIWNIVMDGGNLGSWVIAIIFGPISGFIIWSCYKDAWAKVNFETCREALEPWNVRIRMDTNVRSELCISWVNGTVPNGRRECSYRDAYKALRKLEKMPIADWTLLHLPRLQSDKYVQKANKTVKLFKG